MCAFEVTDAFGVYSLAPHPHLCSSSPHIAPGHADVDDLRKLARRRPTADGGRLPKGKRGLVELVVELCRSGGPLSRFLPAEVSFPGTMRIVHCPPRVSHAACAVSRRWGRRRMDSGVRYGLRRLPHPAPRSTPLFVLSPASRTADQGRA